LLNKTDLVDEAELAPIEARIRKVNPSAEIYRCQQSKVEPKNLIGIQAFNLEKTLEMDPEFLDTEAEHEHDPSVSSTSTRFEGYLNVNKLNTWIGEIIQTMGANLFRYKGVLAVAGMKQKFVFQGVGMLFSGNFSDQKWGPDETRECRFVFIGKDLDKKRLIDDFMDCQCDEKLRFAVGSKVSACTGKGATGWSTGTVIKCWDEGNPYRIQLDDDEGTNIWAPVDIDSFCKAAK
jgi:G3E family GTPase